ncbi:Ankyrin repeat-containing domain protein [Metarhizium guizhouense ARSEF 977]|uniref:Ankyrin repeat-containing domain protein n=1 Tax=Metarhizium guizhouense (strain ARSEF 977) TaxID=1276136 RepID=A0A0B4HKV9_METGA|nr:Ankyrin repeat-containing domain protein [Metarhizium guizhouense ARSEF 977]
MSKARVVLGSILVLAIRAHDEGMAKMLLEHKPDLLFQSCRGETALYCASQAGYLSMADLLKLPGVYCRLVPNQTPAIFEDGQLWNTPYFEDIMPLQRCFKPSRQIILMMDLLVLSDMFGGKLILFVIWEKKCSLFILGVPKEGTIEQCFTWRTSAQMAAITLAKNLPWSFTSPYQELNLFQENSSCQF